MQPVNAEAGRGQERNSQPLHAVQLADALLRIQTIADATGFLKAGNFPSPVRIGARCTRWKAADVRVWLQAQGDAP